MALDSGAYDKLRQAVGDTDLAALFFTELYVTSAGITVGNTAASKVGFFGATPVSQRLKASYNDWAGVSDVVDALVDLGLFDQA